MCPDCPTKLDLAFVLDSSGSIQYFNEQSWADMLSFVAGVVARLDIGPDSVHVGVITFGSLAQVDIYLGDYTHAG